MSNKNRFVIVFYDDEITIAVNLLGRIPFLACLTFSIHIYLINIS